MPLQPGQKLGPYEIVAAIGAGGMGEVYKAADPRLERTVAIKVMPDRMALSDELRARFQREAKAISSLNHPNICTLHDVGHEDGIDFLVMEFLEGESLAERLQQGPLPTPDLLRIAIEVADGLDTAHRQGLVHRDLKPGNVMLTRSGAKILDFGLAKFGAGPGTTDSATQVTIPVTAPLTTDGTILGTIQYMSPEALEGSEADARSDIFAFGAMLYEMATGHKAFQGKSQASLIASILKEQPPAVSQLQPLTPPMLAQVIEQCLQKEPEDRWQTAGDLKRALRWVVDGGSQAGVPVTVSRRRKRRETLLTAAVGALVLVAGFLGYTAWQLERREPRVVRSNIQLTEETVLWGLAGGMAELSPDGRKLAYVARDSTGGDPKLWVRPLDALEGIPLPGTEWALFPFWSPDSRYIGFFADSKLKKILATGGPSLSLCEAPAGRGGSWNADGVILFTPTAQDVIHQVSAAGGEPAAVTVRDTSRHDYTHRWVQFLPDGRRFLCFVRTVGEGGSPRDAICVGSLDEPGLTELVRAKSNAVYADGQVFFVRERTLMALPFDAGSGRATGDPVPIAERIVTMENWSRGVFTAASGGLLVYREGEITSGSQLEIMSVDGGPQGRVGPPETQYSPRVSPDGKRIAVDVEDMSSGNIDIWIWNLDREIRSRLTFDPGADIRPVWSPDGREIAFYSARDAGRGVYVRAADGTGDARFIAPAEGQARPNSWSPDGRFILFDLPRAGGRDIWLAHADGGAPPEPCLAAPYDEWEAAVSPDGRWLAFVSDESGAEEVYVTGFPEPGAKWQVSNHEGDRPRWSPDGNLLYYLDNDDHINVAEVDGTGEAFDVGPVRQLHELTASRPGAIYDLFPDGERIVVNHRLGTDLLTGLVLVQNWPQELR